MVSLMLISPLLRSYRLDVCLLMTLWVSSSWVNTGLVLVPSRLLKITYIPMRKIEKKIIGRIKSSQGVSLQGEFPSNIVILGVLSHDRVPGVPFIVYFR